MQYIRFSPVSRNEWSVSAPAKSAKPIATITHSHGHYSTTFAADYAPNREIVAGVLDFIEDRERKQAA